MVLPFMFLFSDLLWEYRIELVAMELPCMGFIFPTRIFCRDVSDLSIKIGFIFISTSRVAFSWKLSTLYFHFVCTRFLSFRMVIKNIVTCTILLNIRSFGSCTEIQRLLWLYSWCDKHANYNEQLQIYHLSSFNYCLDVASLLIFFEAIAWNIIHVKCFINYLWISWSK